MGSGSEQTGRDVPDSDDPETPDGPDPAVDAAFHEHYRQERDRYLEGHNEASESFDKYLITLSSGALGLSMLYIEKFVKLEEPRLILGLVVAWICFGASLCIVLGSFLASQRTWRWLVERVDHEERQRATNKKLSFKSCRPPRFLSWLFWVKASRGENPWHPLIERMNLWAMLLFFAGVMSLLVFCGFNLPKKEPANVANSTGGQSDKPSQPREERGNPGVARPATTSPPKSTPKTVSK